MIHPTRLWSSFVLFLSYDLVHASGEQQTPLTYSKYPWHQLAKRTGGRLHKNTPLAQSCFTSTHTQSDNETCTQVRKNYLDEVFRSNVSGAYIYPQWETCQSQGAVSGCLLDDKKLGNVNPSSQCRMGSIPHYFIDLKEEHAVSDVQAAFEFTKQTKVPLVIKNTGHDYSGRSSAPHSLALWTHNLKQISHNSEFIPEGCAASTAQSAITLGAGVQWGQAYNFADQNNVTIVGGSDQSVGASGGWLQGGGHSGLSNTMGLGVDRVLEFKVVTPDGVYRTVNACQNEDLFFALRGGGGGTFGVVLESTIMASPRVTIQAVVLLPFPKNTTATEILWRTMADNSLQWAQDGWGGWATGETAVYINPLLTTSEAEVSMKPLIEMSKAQGMRVIVKEFDSWMSFFNFFVSQHVAIVGVNLTLGSRLINKSNFATANKKSELVSALLATKQSPGITSMILLISAPASFPGDGKTSMTSVWRDSIFHVTVVSPWNVNSTVEEVKQHYGMVDDAVEHMRKITLDGAYQNEVAVHEPNYEFTFWGDNYPELLRIKRKYDPDHLLDCWKCVGWRRDSPQFGCYV